MKKIKTIKTIKTIYLCCIFFIIAGCKEDQYNNVIYYDTIGEGYIFMYDSLGNLLYPMQGVEVAVTTDWSYVDNGYSNVRVSLCWTFSLGPSFPSITDSFTTNNEGRYQVRFVKSSPGSGGMFGGTMSHYTNSYWFDCNRRTHIKLSVEEVKNAKNNIVLLDTIKLYK